MQSTDVMYKDIMYTFLISYKMILKDEDVLSLNNDTDLPTEVEINGDMILELCESGTYYQLQSNFLYHIEHVYIDN